eukprot:2258627-Rhodomonas_salina.1
MKSSKNEILRANFETRRKLNRLSSYLDRPWPDEHIALFSQSVRTPVFSTTRMRAGDNERALLEFQDKVRALQARESSRERKGWRKKEGAGVGSPRWGGREATEVHRWYERGQRQAVDKQGGGRRVWSGSRRCRLRETGD